MAKLVDANGSEIADQALPGEPAKKPAFGTLGDPMSFTCVSAKRLEGWAFKANPNTLRATVGEITFELTHGMRVVAEVVRVQTRIIDVGGKPQGKGHLELDFRGKGAGVRTVPAIQPSEESGEFIAGIIKQWQSFRDAEGYGVPLLTPKAEQTKTSAMVED